MAQCNYIKLSQANTQNLDNPAVALSRTDTQKEFKPIAHGLCEPIPDDTYGGYVHYKCNTAGTEIAIDIYDTANCTGSINATYTQAEAITAMNAYSNGKHTLNDDGITSIWSLDDLECQKQEPCSMVTQGCASGCGSTVDLEGSSGCDQNNFDGIVVGVCTTQGSVSYVWNDTATQPEKDAMIAGQNVGGSMKATCEGTDAVQIEMFSDTNCQTKTSNMTLSSGCNNEVEMLVKCGVDGTIVQVPTPTPVSGATTAEPTPASGARRRFSGLIVTAMTAAMAVAMVTM